jgi:hypothetical protein
MHGIAHVAGRPDGEIGDFVEDMPRLAGLCESDTDDMGINAWFEGFGKLT